MERLKEILIQASLYVPNPEIIGNIFQIPVLAFKGTSSSVTRNSNTGFNPNVGCFRNDIEAKTNTKGSFRS